MTKKTVFGFKAPEQSPGFLLWQTTTMWQRLLKKVLDPYDLSHPQFVLLALAKWFEENGLEASQVALARKSCLEVMTVSKALKKLLSMELIVRTESTRDPRANLIRLSAQGKKIIAEVVPRIEQADKEFFKVLGSKQEKELTKILCALTAGTTKE